MNDVYFKASLQNTLNPEVGTFDNVNNKEGTFTLEDGEYYLTNNTSNSYRVYYPTKDIYSVGFTIEFDINYNSNSGFKWLLLFNGDDSTYWHGFSLNSSILRYVGNGLSDHDLITSTNTWLHVKCIFDYYFNQNAVHIYIDNVEVNNFIISNNYGIKYIDILGNSSGYVADAKIKNIIIYNSSKKHYLDTIGLTSLWSKIKSLFATKTELGSKANDSEVVHKSGNETIAATKTFSSNIVGNLTGNADTATKATQDSDGNQINTTYSKNGHTHDDRYYTESEVNNLLNGKANDADVVHKSGDETIAGSKTFNNIKLIGNNDLITNTSDSSYTTIVGGTSSNNSPFLQLVGNTWGYEPNRGMFILSANNGTTRCDLQGKLPNGELYWGGKVIYGLDNTCDLGNSNKRFKDIYATNATINTSDRNAKQDISVIDDKLLDAWGNINPVTFKLISSIEHKGDNARIHTGYIAQDVKEELDKYGIDACKYGLFCYNSWDVQEEKSHEEERTDEEGNTKTVKVIDTPAREAGETYGLRYIECLVVECAYLRKKNKELEERITKLEENLYA